MLATLTSAGSALGLDPDRARRERPLDPPGDDLVLGAVLGAAQELLAEVVVDRRVGAAAGRAGERDGRRARRRAGGPAAPGWRRGRRPRASRRRSRSRTETARGGRRRRPPGRGRAGASTATSRPSTTFSSAAGADPLGRPRRPSPRSVRAAVTLAIRWLAARVRVEQRQAAVAQRRQAVASSRATRLAGSAPAPVTALKVSQVSPPVRSSESSGSTSSAGGNEDHGGERGRRRGRRRSRPSTPGRRRPAGPSGSSASRPRVIAAHSRTRSAKRPAPREIASCAEPRPASANPSRSGCSQANQRSPASREAKTAALGSSISTSTVDADQPAAPRRRAAVELVEALERRCAGVLESSRRAASAPGRDLVIATSPVRAISIRPCGRTMRSKESILSCEPVTSIVSVRRETSTILRVEDLGELHDLGAALDRGVDPEERHLAGDRRRPAPCRGS